MIPKPASFLSPRAVFRNFSAGLPGNFGYGLLIVMLGAGSLVGSFVVGRAVSLLGRPGVLFASTLLFAGAIALPAITADARIIAGGLFVIGIAGMTWNVTNVSMRQAILPSRLMGRVHATHRFVATLAGLLGAIAAGAIGEIIGLRAVFAIGGVIVLLALLGAFVVTEDRIRAAESAGGTT